MYILLYKYNALFVLFQITNPSPALAQKSTPATGYTRVRIYTLNLYYLRCYVAAVAININLNDKFKTG